MNYFSVHKDKQYTKQHFLYLALLTGMGFMVQASSDKQVLSGHCLFFYHDHRSGISRWANLGRPCRTSGSRSSGRSSGSSRSSGISRSSNVSMGWLLPYNNTYLLHCKKIYIRTILIPPSSPISIMPL